MLLLLGWLKSREHMSPCALSACVPIKEGFLAPILFCWFIEQSIRFLCHALKTKTYISSVPLQVHRKIREDSDMAQDSLQCLAQLASMHGPVFPDEGAQVSYLAHLVEGLLSMINGSVLLFTLRLLCL